MRMSVEACDIDHHPIARGLLEGQRIEQLLDRLWSAEIPPLAMGDSQAGTLLSLIHI